MKIFSNFTLTAVNVSTTNTPELILCFKECLNKYKYAGLKPKLKDNSIAGSQDNYYYQCFCGDDYNQTFAVDEAMCTYRKHRLMKIYNTDYDIKPLLSVPGNQSNLVEIWNATEKYKAMFVKDVMRNPAIDWWNDKLLYNTPEYVKVSAMNKYGQELWAIEFFTNESSANLTEWLKPQNALNREVSTSANISVDIRQIVIKSKTDPNKYYFFHGLIEKYSSRVTVVTRDGNPQSNQACGMDEAALQTIHLTKLETGARYICGVEMQEKINITTKPDNDIITTTHNVNIKYFLDSCVLASVVNLKECGSTEVFVYVHVGNNKQWELKINSSELKDKDYCITGMEVIKKCVLTIKNFTGVSAEIETNAELYGTHYFEDCVKTSKVTAHIISKEVFIYTVKDDALLLVDRVVVLGYYHKEEPKVSKWEFLNDFSIEEVQNIMRPVLQKVQSQGSVPVRNLSSSVRKKESATDMRMSSQGIGILGGCLLGLVFLIIFVSDLVIIKVQLTALFKNLSRLCKTNNPRRISDFGEK